MQPFPAAVSIRSSSKEYVSSLYELLMISKAYAKIKRMTVQKNSNGDINMSAGTSSIL